MLDYLLNDPLTGWLLFVFLGLVVGSFLNVVIHRFPIMQVRGWLENDDWFREEILPKFGELPTGRYDLLLPRSACPGCGRPISAIENVPVLSYLFMLGRCRGCGRHISFQYPLVELAGALVAVAAFVHFGVSGHALAACVFGWTLLALAVIDLRTKFLFDDITLPLLWLGIGINYFGVFATLDDAVLGAIAGYAPLWLFANAYVLVANTVFNRGLDVAMAPGDFKLFAAIGAWLGWQYLIAVILLSALVGSVVGIGLMVAESLAVRNPEEREGWAKQIPFGPYLAGAGLLAMYFGDTINRDLLHLPF